MRLAIALGTATMGHALLLCGLGWVAPPPRSAEVPEKMVQVDVAVLDGAGDGSLRSAVSDTRNSTSTGQPLFSSPRRSRSHRSGRLDNPSGPPIRVAPAMIAASAVTTEVSTPAIVSPSVATPVFASIVGGDSESSSKAAAPGVASTPGLASHTTEPPPSAAGVRYRSHPPPVYPTDSLRRREEGVVLLSVDIGPDGRATQVSLSKSSGSPSLDSAATEAVYSWTFEPARNAGVPVASHVVVPVRFSLINR